MVKHILNQTRVRTHILLWQKAIVFDANVGALRHYIDSVNNKRLLHGESQRGRGENGGHMRGVGRKGEESSWEGEEQLHRERPLVQGLAFKFLHRFRQDCVWCTLHAVFHNHLHWHQSCIKSGIWFTSVRHSWTEMMSSNGKASHHSLSYMQISWCLLARFC